jgi:hypothetical protein
MLTADPKTGPVLARTVEGAARARLATTGYRALKAVECFFHDGRMTLRGQVPSYYHKQMAQEALRDATHVSQVINHLEVVS